MQEAQYKYYLDEGIFNFRNGNYQNAIDYINKSIDINRDFAVSYFYRAACYQALENWSEAMLDYTKTLELDNKMVDAYYNRAKIILSRKDIENPKIENAISDLKKALELDPLFQDALFAMAAAKKKQSKYEEAIEYLDELIKINPDHIYGKALKKLILTKYLSCRI